MFGLKCRGFQFYHYIAFQADVIKQQINKKLVAVHFQAVLSPDKGKTTAQFQQKAGDILHQRVFHFPLLRIPAQAQKVKQIRIF